MFVLYIIFTRAAKRPGLHKFRGLPRGVKGTGKNKSFFRRNKILVKYVPNIIQNIIKFFGKKF